MRTGWQNVGGLYYYMDPSGAMLHDATTPDGYKVNHDGVWVSENTTSKSSGSTGEIKDGEDGWHKTASGWYKDGMGGTKTSYYDSNRNVVYMFDSNGYLKSYKIYNVGGLGADSTWLDSTDPNVVNGQTTEKVNTGTDSGNTKKDEEYEASFDSADTEQMAKDMIRLINEERKKAGRDSLEIDDKLMEAAKIRAEELTENFSHTRPDGSDCLTVFDEVGFEGRPTGENIARIFYGAVTKRTVDDVTKAAVDGWMHSAGHKRNILRKNATKVGAAIAFNKTTKRAFCVMDFGE